MVLPFTFTCGIVLTDTTDGFGMRFAYGWAFMRPIRKVYYLTMTVISVLVAVAIGTIELLGVLASELSLNGVPFGLWTTVDRLKLDLNTELGFTVGEDCRASCLSC